MQLFQSGAYTEETKLDTQKSITELLEGNHLAQHAVNFDTADQCLKEGALLPTPSKKRSDFDTTANYFKSIHDNSEELYIALRTSPEIIIEQDENGQTLLHHAATVGHMMGSNGASLIHYLLFSAPGVDFTIKDNNGNTAVHLAAMASQDRVTCQYIFPNYMKKALEMKFDFSTLNKQGQTILHIATRTSYNHPFFGRINNVKQVLEISSSAAIDTLSSSGSTAFYYALNWMYLAEARSLLTAGADPMLCGNIERHPLLQVYERLRLFSNITGASEAKAQERIAELTSIKDTMFTLQAEKENKRTSSFSLLDYENEYLTTHLALSTLRFVSSTDFSAPDGDEELYDAAPDSDEELYDAAAESYEQPAFARFSP